MILMIDLDQIIKNHNCVISCFPALKLAKINGKAFLESSEKFLFLPHPTVQLKPSKYNLKKSQQILHKCHVLEI
jgi:hypothetical protein